MNGVQVSMTKNKFVIRAPFACVGECQRIPSRRFVKKAKAWVAPVTKLNSRYLLDTFKMAAWSDEALAMARESANRKPPTHKPFPGWYTYRTTPYDHQRKALDKAWEPAAFALFMEMGTGKTKATIDLICARAIDAQVRAALIVAPLSVVLSWRDEILTHSTVHSNITVLRTKKETTVQSKFGVKLPDGFQWYLANVEGLSAGGLFSTIISAIAGKPLAMVVDESTRIKNPQAIRTKRCLDLATFAKYRMILSGLPTLKGPIDLFAQFQFLDPEIIGAGDFYCFRNRYVVMGGYENREILGYQNLEELTTLVEPYSYSITKKQALDLPDKIYKTMRVELTKEQKTMMRVIRTEGRVGTHVLKNVLEKVLRLQQIASGIAPATETEPETDIIRYDKNPKIVALMDILEEYNEQQFVVWCNFKREVALVSEALTAAKISHVVHVGETKQDDRQEAKAKFQEGKARGFIGTIQSGGIGITLTAGSLVVYVSNSWSLEGRAQSEDRTHRIGQVRAVEYINIVAEGSVDELVLDALHEKRDLAEHVRTLIENRDSIRGISDDNLPF